LEEIAEERATGLADGEDPAALVERVVRAIDVRRLGESLKRAQAEQARRAGYNRVKWTTNSLASRPLRLYLTKLGARLTRFRQGMYAAVRNDPFPDEVEIEWTLDGAPVPHERTAPARSLLSSRQVAPGARRLTGVDENLDRLGSASYLVEVPWDREQLLRIDAAAASDWVLGVRRTMTSLLEAGYVGTHVALKRSTSRSFVRFDRWP
jgi:predicted GNAT superfamily acetyltransferase